MADLNTTPAWFNVNEYLANKVEQLNSTSTDGKVWTVPELVEVLFENGMSPYEHFVIFGNHENVSPNNLFNFAEYLYAKTEQLNAIAFNGSTNWTPAATLKAFNDAGLSAWDHYTLCGMNEGVNPSNAFDTNAYLLAKAAYLNNDPLNSNRDWSPSSVLAEMHERGINAIEDYFTFGKDAGINISEVPENQQVDVPTEFNPWDPGSYIPPTPVEPDSTVTVVTDVNTDYTATRMFEGNYDVFSEASGISASHLNGTATGIILDTVLPAGNNSDNPTNNFKMLKDYSSIGITDVYMSSDGDNYLSFSEGYNNNTLYNWHGGKGNDQFAINTGTMDTYVDGSAGNDTFIISSSAINSILLGGSGNDTFTFNQGSAFGGTAQGGSGNDTFNIGDSKISGDSYLSGDSGNDTFNITAAVEDTLILNGGTGNDTFNITAAPTGNIVITGGAGADTVQIGTNISTTLNGSTGITLNSGVETLVLNKGTVITANNSTDNLTTSMNSNSQFVGGSGVDTIVFNDTSIEAQVTNFGATDILNMSALGGTKVQIGAVATILGSAIDLTLGNVVAATGGTYTDSDAVLAALNGLTVNNGISATFVLENGSNHTNYVCEFNDKNGNNTIDANEIDLVGTVSAAGTLTSTNFSTEAIA